jgi:PAS domain S-box-containing protein
MSPDGAESARSNPTLRGFLRQLRLVWKVNGFFLLILVLVLGVTGYLWNLDYERSELAAARETSRLTSDRILQRVNGLMLRHEIETLEEVVSRMAAENPAFREIRLISHAGDVVVSQLESRSEEVGADTWPCTACHTEAPSVPPETLVTCCEGVIEFDDGERAVSVVTPVFREEGCGNGQCHTEMGSSSVLGLIQADFSLARVDALIAQRNRHTLLAILFSLLLGTAAAWWMTDRVMGRRLRALREGASRLAAQDYSFRFSDGSGDGLAQIGDAFNSMTSELSTALHELTSAREHLQAIVENSADMIITVDPSGLVTTFNPGAEKILGYRAEEVIGRRIEVLFADPAERDAAIEQLDHSEHVVNYITRFVTKEGDTRNVMVTLSRLRSPDGESIGTMGISKDVTEELRLQRQLLRTKRMAALGQAVTGIQHTIKNMLNVMKGGSYMVKLGLSKDDSAMVAEGWEMVQQGIDDMTQMSLGMLDFVRTKKLRLKPTDLGELARSVQNVNRAKFREKGVALELEVKEGTPDVICDGDMIRSVMMDLLANALDACAWKAYGEGESARVTIGVGRAGANGYVDIEIRDNGEGMREEVRRRVFTPFFSTKAKTGTGMGLAVVDRIVSSHEGKTTVESEPGAGATFRVSLPTAGPSLTEE